MTKLKYFEPDKFLQDYWQKKPLFIKNPWHDWSNPLEPDELAGLACEDNIESRLVVQSEEGWSVEHGPFAESRFSTLGTRQWTLLVQAVDHYAPPVAELLRYFKFIPNWRIDDIMVSYAVEDGGVGPHFDQYDVFLIQGRGKRRWQIGDLCDDKSKLIPNDQLKLLADFEPIAEWICEPGDILYIPPGISHNGNAIGDECMTYSVGFRAPSQSELMCHWVDEMPANILDHRYSDPDLQQQGNPGEISPKAIDRLHDIAGSKLMQRDDFSEWFGIFNSTTKYPEVDWTPEHSLTEAELLQRLRLGTILEKNPASRFSFIRHRSDFLMLFVDGQMFECNDNSMRIAEHICQHNQIDLSVDSTDSTDAIKLLSQLYNQGSLYCEQDETVID